MSNNPRAALLAFVQHKTPPQARTPSTWPSPVPLPRPLSLPHCSLPISSPESQDFAQKVLKLQLDHPIPISIVPLEDVRHPLQTDARLDEEIERDLLPVVLVVGVEEELDERVREAVAER